MKRALKSNNIKSTDDEADAQSVHILPNDSLERQLNNIQPFFTNESSENSSSRKFNKSGNKPGMYVNLFILFLSCILISSSI